MGREAAAIVAHTFDCEALARWGWWGGFVIVRADQTQCRCIIKMSWRARTHWRRNEALTSWGVGEGKGLRLRRGGDDWGGGECGIEGSCKSFIDIRRWVGAFYLRHLGSLWFATQLLR